MKHNYLFSRRLMPMVLAVLWLAAFSNLASAQQPGRMQPGILRIKVTEQLAQQLETANLTQTPTHVLMTGIRSLDLVHEQYKVTSLKRVFRNGGKFEARHRRHGLHLWYEVKMDPNAVLPAALEAYRGVPGIQHAEPSYSKIRIGDDGQKTGPRIDAPQPLKPPAAATLPGASNDPRLGEQWHYNNTGQAGGTPGLDIALYRAWGLTTGTPNVVVAVTDGGAQVNHPDLAANMWVNTGEIPGNNIDDDNNGYVDDINGYGFGDDTGEIAPDDHGTHTSGTIAAVTNNGIGVAGVAGGSGTGDGVRIMSCAAFGATASAGFELTYVYAADNGAVISQNSWGYRFAGVVDQVVLDAIDYFIAEAGKDENGNQVGPMNGGIVIFAAGNSNLDDQWYPGYYEPTLAVAALDNKDNRASYSNFGAWVDIAAPGGDMPVFDDPHGVLSTIANNQYAFIDGTSMACPHVSGVAALLVSKLGGPGFTPAMLRQRLTQRVTDVYALNPSFAGKLGSGKVNAFAALSENDGVAPNPITDLEVVDSTFHSLTVEWTAPSDANNGAVWEYEVTYGNLFVDPGEMEPFHANNVPAPGPPGTRQRVTIEFLENPHEEFHITARSKDFFGNWSAVASTRGTTGFAPQFEMAPVDIQVTVPTAQTAIATTTVGNGGGEPLIFRVERAVGNLATPDVQSDTLVAGESVDIHFTIDAHNVPPGNYDQVFFLLTNEPYSVSSHRLSISVHVVSNGAPIAVVQPDTIAFGAVYTGVSKTELFTIHNDGAEPLVVTDIASNNPVFAADFTGPDTLAAFETDTVYVTFTPTAEQAEWGVLAITTNDPAHAYIEVGLSGEGVTPPELAVSPASLSAILFTGQLETQTLTLSNAGGADLQYAVTILPANVTAKTVVKNVTIPSNPGAATGRAVLKQPRQAAQTATPGTIPVKSVVQTASVIKVLILSPDDDLTDLEALLDAFDDVEADVFSPALLPTLSASALKPYDVVITNNNAQWAAADVSATAVGNVLADYVDDGGKVIANSFVYSYDAWRLAGRFITEQYGPFTPSTSDALITTSLGTIDMPGHPIMAGVESLTYLGFVQNVGLAPGAVPLAHWANGDLFAAANTRVVALNILPSFGDGSGVFSWTGDLPTFYQNAIHYLKASSFIEVTPITGIVPGGQDLDLQATFNASGLDSGVYHANIHITSNAPQQPLAIVPATLTVAGPEFSVSPTALAVTVGKDETVSQTLVVTNHSAVPRNYTVSVEAGLATLAVTPAAAQARRVPATTRSGPSVSARGASPGIGAGKEAIALRTQDESFARAASAPVQTSVSQYATDFESFAPGNISGQQDWFGLFGNWTVEAENPFGGLQHFRGFSDGFGFSGALSPPVAIGTDAKSTATLKVNIQGSGVTWQVVPQSSSTELVNTRIQFGPDGVMSALVDNGGTAVFDPIGTTPAGYFDLTVEVDRDSSYFHVFVNNVKVYTGQGFTGNIEEVAILSGMEVAGPTADIDNLQIFDGVKEEAPGFVSVSPTSGTLPAGGTVALNVTFSSEDIDFGNYSSTINIALGGSRLRVPATMLVTGAPNIRVSPTVLQDTLAYREESYKPFTITNTGGTPLTYNLQVIGANTTVASLKTAAAAGKPRTAAETRRIQEKQARDAAQSRIQTAATPALQLLAGISLLTENFDGGTFPPAGWEAIDNEGEGVVWALSSDYGYGNFAGTSGEAATVSSDEAGFLEYDAELITPVIQTAGYRNIAVQYNANYLNLANLDFFDLDIQVNGGAWVNVLRWNEDHGGFFGLPGESVTVDLDEYIGTAPASFRLRWHYYNPNDGDFDWYVQIDDVAILGEARAWLNVEPVAGTVPVGGSAQINAHFNAIDSPPGFYVAGILVSSNAAEDPLVGILATLNVLQPAKISVNPSSIVEELNAGEQSTHTLTIANAGQSPLHFDLTDSTHTWLSVLPQSGNVGAGGSQALTVTIDATGLAGGTYVDTLAIASNDPLKPVAYIPVQLTVIVNTPPVLAAISPLEVPETTTQQVIFTATDADQESVTITLHENLSFITRVSGANGTARYNIAPKLGDAGEYDLPVIAVDARGATDSANFHLSVVAYGVDSFSLRNVKTNAIISTFEDSVQLDVADPLFYKLAIRANTKPATVGSVKFWLDGHSLNTENSKPYELTQLAVLFLDGGAHTLKATAYTKANAKGSKGASKEALVRVINSSAVTGFDVVKANGAKVISLDNNGVIDISKSAFRNINIRANVTGSAVKSVVFYLNNRFYRVDNDNAFVLHGNWFGADVPWPATPGWHTLKAVPYSGWYGLGVAGTPVTIKFRVTNGSHGMAAARAADDDDDDIVPAETGSARFSIFPVPVKDELQIAIPRETQGHVRLLIHDAQGKARFTDAGDAEAFFDYSVSTEELKMSNGFYFIQVQYANGVREIRKFVKE
jgi:subtilisin family serine protease